MMSALAALFLDGQPLPAMARDLPLQRQRFAEISSRLCGLPIKPRGLSDVVQAALADAYTPERLARLAELVASTPDGSLDSVIATSDLKDLAEALIAAWYTGMLATGGKTRVLTLEDALAWHATGYAKPPATCGVFGEWTSSPALAVAVEAKP